MPGPAVHYIIGKLLSGETNKLDRQTLNDDYYFDANTRAILEQHSDYLNVGTLGPDFLFFNVKDWPMGNNIPVRKIIETVKVLSSIEHELKKAYPALITIVELKKEIEETLGEVADEIIESSPTLSNIRLIINDVKAIITILGSIVTEATKDLVTSNINIYDMLSHPIQDCQKKTDWWWFDTLHYRRSGQFANYLINNSKNNPKLLAYSIGYMSHVAADTIGHPYVNNIVRGPYRTHSQRHKVVENFQDVSAFQQFGRGLGFNSGAENLSQSNLYERFKFKDGRTSIFSGEIISEAESLIDSMTPGFADVGMPEDLANLFSQATKNVYKDSSGKHIFGGGMSPEEVDAAYRLWYSWFKKSTSEIPLPKSLPDVPALSEDIRKAWEAFKEKLDKVLSTLNDAINDLFKGDTISFSWNNIVNFFKKIARIVNAAVAAAGAMINLIEEILVGALAKFLHFLLNQIYQALYCAYDYFRLSVSLNGLAFPNSHHLADYKIKHMLDPNFYDSNGNRVIPSWEYPVHKVDVGNAVFRHAPQETHLIYPPVDAEFNRVTPAPDSYCKRRHEFYINDQIAFDSTIYNNLGKSNNFIAHQNAMKDETLGNAVMLTAKYWKDLQTGKKIPDLNLDGDRGMAFPSWEKANCTDVVGTQAKPYNVKFKD